MPAEQNTRTTPARLNVLGQKQIAVLTSAVSLSNIPKGTRTVEITVSGAAVRWTADGATTPTAAIGMIMLDGTERNFPYADLTKLQFIQVAATATLDVVFLE